MATILNGILGGFSGKVGTVIGSNWNGIDYMRSRAAHITQPNTPAQLEQRAKFSTVGKFLRPMLHFLRVGYKNKAINMSAFNVAMAYNLENALSGVYPLYEMDYSKVQLSQGKLPEAFNPEVTSTTVSEVDFVWENNSDEPGALATDLALLVVYNPAKQRAVTSVTGSTRASSNKTITLPSSFSGDQVHCYISFSDAKQEELSKSQYVGIANVL